MESIIVIAFDDAETAGKVASDFKRLEKEAAFDLKDARVVVKDDKGKLHVKDVEGHPMAWGAVAGGAIGMIIFILVPFLGAALGALAGAGLVKAFSPDLVDKKFVKDVSEALKPNTSAVFLEVNDEHKIVVIKALEPYHGTLIQTTVSPEMEAELKKALEA